MTVHVLLQSLASIPQIYQSIFQINRPERKTVYSEPWHVLRGEKCPDASRMFALKHRVRRDLNTDVSVYDWHVRLATRWRLAIAKGLRENCRDVGRVPTRKVHTVICHRSGQHYLKSVKGCSYTLVSNYNYTPKNFNFNCQIIYNVSHTIWNQLHNEVSITKCNE